jgi:hypothetical protein
VNVVATILAVAIGLLGVIFLAGSQGQVSRLVVGLVLLAGAVTLVAVSRLRPRVEQRNIVQSIDLSGDVRPELLTCRQCGAQLSKDDLSVRAGAVLVQCRYCDAAYHLEEEPKW